jgi:hypothetical protein
MTKPSHSDNEEDKIDETEAGQNKADLQAKLDDISTRLARIERVLARLEPEMGEFQQSTRLIRDGMDFYGNLFEMMGRFSGRQRLQKRYPILAKDEISRLIVEALEPGKPMNISQLTAAVRRGRGTASRRIIRERVQQLLEKGLIQESHKDKKATYYRWTETLL